MGNIQVSTGSGTYTIYTRRRSLAAAIQLLSLPVKRTVIVSDATVHALYGSCFPQCHHHIIPPGEQSKTIAVVMDIVEHLLQLELGRDAVVVALGGGVVGDIAGFAASIYMRGVKYVQVPTTLLAQVDSSVGGKTGVNTAYGKNMVGTFWQPTAVVIDPETLLTLQKKEIINGLGEVVKYGIIYDYSFFTYIRTHLPLLQEPDLELMETVIQRCCAIKAAVVGQDEKEAGLRKILNFGHTIGHGIETLRGYGSCGHGEAVLIGMLWESRLAVSLGLLDPEYYAEIEAVLEQFSVDYSLAGTAVADLIGCMARDKKNKDGKISFLLPCARGRVQEELLTPAQVETAFRELML